MTNAQIYSWIFYATALASEQSPAKWADVSLLADGINHAVPTHKEMQGAMSFCIEQGLIRSAGKRVELTSAGSDLLSSCSHDLDIYLDVWRRLEEEF